MDRFVNVKIKRRIFEKNNEYYENYKVPFESGMSAMDLLKYIQLNLDSSLTFYCSCKVGLCGGCNARINGKNSLLCAYPVDGEDITIEPFNDNTLRDLL